MTETSGAEHSLAEQIASSLRRDILLGKLAPGALIKERDSSADRGVSRTPLREAIRILASEGLVVLRPSRSPVVANPSLKEIIDDLVVMNTL
ncbi:MAG: GntR family transcriptional regulator, partial [Paracoccaceae bacterium]|nr:GntR family transcriptional regulator [Paracoccaceae bacterium]